MSISTCDKTVVKRPPNVNIVTLQEQVEAGREEKDHAK